MSLKVDDLSTFKSHRNNVSESLSTEIIGREKDIEELCLRIRDNNYVAIVGAAGIGKSRLGIAAIEEYSKLENSIILCTKNFGDYIEALEQSLGDDKYIIFIDDANTYKIVELLNYIKYKNANNIKVVMTVRDYLKQCLYEDEVVFYEVASLEDKYIQDAIFKNTEIKNGLWVDQIVKIANGNIRVAFLAASEALKDTNGFNKLFNQNDVLTRFYMNEMKEISESDELIITAGIIAFFRSIYLEQLFYIAPILNSVGMSKQLFVKNAHILISKEIIDDYNNVVKISDQCFADYLLNYTIVKMKYFKISDLLLVGYKYYKKRVIESLSTILNVYYNDEFVHYLKTEIIEICDDLNENIDLKHQLEISFCGIASDYVITDFKDNVEKYDDIKDIKWLLGIISNLALTEYEEIIIEGAFKLIEKTKEKKNDVFKVLCDAYALNHKSIENGFKYLMIFVKYLIDKKIYNDAFYLLITSYLKYSFNYVEWQNKLEYRHYAFNIDDNNKNILEFRTICWEYLFNFEPDKVIDVVLDFANHHIINNCVEIVKNDLIQSQKLLKEFRVNKILDAILYVKLIDEAQKFNFEDLLNYINEYIEILDIILERKAPSEDYGEYELRYNECVKEFINKRTDVFMLVDELDFILQKHYSYEKQKFIKGLLVTSNTYSNELFDTLVKNEVSPYEVFDKLTSLIDLDSIYDKIMLISDPVKKDTYEYQFYRYISINNFDKSYNFVEWIRSKDDKDTKNSYSRRVIDLINIANKNNIGYIELVRKFYNKRKYNVFISTTYLDYLIYNDGEIERLLEIDDKLAIEIYEFLLFNNKHDYNWECLEKIIAVKKNYIKVFANKFIDENIDADGEINFVFKEECCDKFLNECFTICLSADVYYPPFNLCRLISNYIDNVNLQNWIERYIESNYRNEKAMEILFSALAQVRADYRNKYLLQYYKLGNSKLIIRCALLHKVQSFSDARSHYNSLINELEELKKTFMTWDNVEIINFIDILIDDHRNSIRLDEIDKMVEYENQDVFRELRDMDYKTEISSKDAFELYVHDSEFKKFINSGYASYKNGSYVTPNEEPVKFVDILKDRKILTIRVKEDSSYEEYLSSMNSIINKFEDDSNVTLDQCLISLFNERDWKVKDFVDNTLVKRNTYYQICKNNHNKMDKKTMVQILIGLCCPKAQRDMLLKLNETPLLDTTLDDLLYEFILGSKMDCLTADELLRELGKDGFK